MFISEMIQADIVAILIEITKKKKKKQPTKESQKNHKNYWWKNKCKEAALERKIALKC